uniref:Putative lipocalin-5 1 n=1 Tax=Amblyomma triste TaxID=251400 RepID=A0A023G999_AMBTT
MRLTMLALVLIAAHIALLVAPTSGKAPHILPRNVTDAFELFAHFPYVVLVYSSGDDPEFQCLTNKRTSLDMDARTSTYVWMFKGHGGTKRRNVVLSLSAGDAPDKVVLKLSDKPGQTWMAHFIYTDYKDCVIVDIPYDGQNCQLWVSKRVKNDVPQYCLDQLHDICDVSVEEYSQELCQNETDDP